MVAVFFAGAFLAAGFLAAAVFAAGFFAVAALVAGAEIVARGTGGLDLNNEVASIVGVGRGELEREHAVDNNQIAYYLTEAY